MAKKVIDQKEYLRKYLSSGIAKDIKKKKKKKIGSKTMKIIDDNIDLKNMRPTENGEFKMFVDSEKPPKIARILDEQGPDDFIDKRRLKVIVDDNEGGKKQKQYQSSVFESQIKTNSVNQYLEKHEAELNKLLKNDVGESSSSVPVQRDRRRLLKAEAAEQSAKEERQVQLDKKYAIWRRGLKQVENHEERLKQSLYEINKPLARYADDEDLNKELREREREEDPMLEYLKQKQIKEGKRKPDRPSYQGAFVPNRFGIKPGLRWDGVDRSNGYEKKWFEVQNAKVAWKEEAYKWSTADM